MPDSLAELNYFRYPLSLLIFFQASRPALLVRRERPQQQ